GRVGGGKRLGGAAKGPAPRGSSQASPRAARGGGPPPAPGPTKTKSQSRSTREPPLFFALKQMALVAPSMPARKFSRAINAGDTNTSTASPTRLATARCLMVLEPVLPA